jgi:hypothetical protein
MDDGDVAVAAAEMADADPVAAVVEAKPKKQRRRGNTLEKWEVAIVKAMIARGGSFTNDQEILAYFTRPNRTVNHRLIGEIRNSSKHKDVKAAEEVDLDAYLSNWPDLDDDTGLSRRGDELLIKAREAMIAAVHVFNSAGLTFRAELFIVSSVIAWTYLLHAWFKREGVDYRYAGGKTKEGAEKYWELGHCLRQGNCPAKGAVAKNLEFLLAIRHEIEHRSTNRIDDALGAKLQACAINFNAVLKAEFGAHYGLEKRLPIALQFVNFGADQRAVLKKASGLPSHVSTCIESFEAELTAAEMDDPAYRMKIAFVPIAAKRPGAADSAIEFVKPGSPDAEEVGRIVFKEVNRKRHPPSEIVAKVKAAGYPKFSMHHHSRLWNNLDAKGVGNDGYGGPGDYNGSWVWYDKWLERALEYCASEGDRFR